MNSFELKCYQITYQNPQYWHDSLCKSVVEQEQMWANCRALTDSFYDELVTRGYLVPRSSNSEN